MSPRQIKPIVKWVGGKSQLLDEISQRYPKNLGKSINRYAEPFVGGGAVLFDILSKYDLESVYINDINWSLVNLYTVVRDKVNELISILKDYSSTYADKNEEERKEFFLLQRNKFNEIEQVVGKIDVELAALFIFLNKTCFNGLYRVNRKGKFNVPFGKYANPTICDELNLLAVSKALEKVIIKRGDFKSSEAYIDEHTFAYFDPPYRPLSVTSSFTSYSSDCFNDENQRDLANYALSLVKKGAIVLLSNSDPHNSNPDDDFFDNIYKDFKIERVQASRAINSKASGRGKINELLISSVKSN